MGAIRKHQYAAASPRQKIWTSMRIIRAFTVADIAATAEVSEGAVTSYLQSLRHAGYVRSVRRSSQRGCMSYRLIMNTGPLAPVDWRTIKTLLDPNTGKELDYA